MKGIGIALMGFALMAAVAAFRAPPGTTTSHEDSIATSANASNAPTLDNADSNLILPEIVSGEVNEVQFALDRLDEPIQVRFAFTFERDGLDPPRDLDERALIFDEKNTGTNSPRYVFGREAVRAWAV